MSSVCCYCIEPHRVNCRAVYVVLHLCIAAIVLGVMWSNVTWCESVIVYVCSVAIGYLKPMWCAG